MLKKITWTRKSVFQWFCWYILFSTIVNVGVIAIFIWKNYEFRIADNFDGTIATILSVLGVFIAFTAINIYSVFNARVEDEKQKLEEVRKKCYNDIADLEIKIEKYHKKFDNFEDKINQSLDVIDDYNLNDEFYDIKHSDVVLDRVRAIYALIERIEKIKQSIDKTDSIGEKEKLEGDLLSLKHKIKQNLEPYCKKIEKTKNKTFKDIFNNFKALLDEESVA